MSDPRDQRLSPEDQHLLELLDGLGPDSATKGSVESADLEAVASLAYGLPDLEPRPEVKRALMRSLEGAASVHEPSSPDVPRIPIAAHDAGSTRLAQLERRSRWYMPIAAALAIALVGLAGWHFKQLQWQRETIAELSAQVESLERDGVALALARNRLNEMQTQMRLLTASGSEFCVLKPWGEAPTHPKATATMVISSDRNRWFLAAQGLEPSANGRSYQLWFITESKPIRAAAFEGAAEGGRVELSGRHEGVPLDVRAIAVTLEVEPEPSEPSEPILFADEAMTLL